MEGGLDFPTTKSYAIQYKNVCSFFWLDCVFCHFFNLLILIQCEKPFGLRFLDATKKMSHEVRKNRIVTCL